MGIITRRGDRVFWSFYESDEEAAEEKFKASRGSFMMFKE